jgi:hypothetical protein
MRFINCNSKVINERQYVVTVIILFDIAPNVKIMYCQHMVQKSYMTN